MREILNKKYSALYANKGFWDVNGVVFSLIILPIHPFFVVDGVESHLLCNVSPLTSFDGAGRHQLIEGLTGTEVLADDFVVAQWFWTRLKKEEM